MSGFSHGPITEIATSNPKVHAFRIVGHMDDDASEALAKHMNSVFDREGKVNMLLDLSAFTGSDWDNILDGDVITSRFRSLRHVERYAVVGAPDAAAKMIGLMDHIIPVKAQAFDGADINEAWAFVGEK